MKKISSLITVCLLPASSLQGQTDVLLHSEDFETGGTNFTPGNANITFALASDPDPSGTQGTVGSADLGGGLARWGSVRSIPLLVPFPPGVEAGTSTFTATMRVHYPTGTTSVPGDRTGFILRWNGVNNQNSNLYVTSDEIPLDTWSEISLSEVIPAVDANGNAVTSVSIVLSFDDGGNDAADGLAVYVDDFRITATTSADDPNLLPTSAINFGSVDQNGGPHTRDINLTNSGLSNDLIIDSAELSGTNLNLFSIPDLPFPLVIPPGESQVLRVSHDPETELGPLSAVLTLVTNDQSSPNMVTLINSESVVPFEGVELVMNGDFETGNLDGWRDNARFDFTDTITRRGIGAGVFNFQGGNQWGDVRQSSTAAPGEETGSIAITPEMHGRPFQYSAWYYRPSVGGPGEDDTISGIFRLNSVNGPGTLSTPQVRIGDMPTDTWVRVSLDGVIPATEADGITPLRQITAIWSFRDLNADLPGGELMFLDDVSFRVNLPSLVPTTDLVISNLVIDRTTDDVSFNFPATIGTEYTIERSVTLLPDGEPGGWLAISDVVADETMESFTDPAAAAASPLFFYRVRAVE